MKQNIERYLKAQWIKACRWDGMPIDTTFAVFSDDNPYAKRHNDVMRLYLAGRK